MIALGNILNFLISCAKTFTQAFEYLIKTNYRKFNFFICWFLKLAKNAKFLHIFTGGADIECSLPPPPQPPLYPGYCYKLCFWRLLLSSMANGEWN